jgi:pimeloyl-ACP methyl ester carboxylesterase
MADPGTTLVMLPGLDGTGLVFGPLLACLPAEISAEPVCYPADRVMTFPEHVELARLCLPADRPFVLLAESFSGPVALQLLADPPTNLLGVILVATFARYPRPFLVDAARHLPQALLLKFFASPLISRFFCLGMASKEAIRLFCGALLSVQLKVLSSRLRIVSELPPPPSISFAGPALYLQAGHDRLVPPRAAAAMRQYLPQLRLEKIPGPHTILLARPQQGASLISSFMSSLKNPQGQTCREGRECIGYSSTDSPTDT